MLHRGAGLVGRHFVSSSVCRTSHRIWVAFLALKSSGVSSSTVSPLPFTPSSRSLLYSLYRKNDKRHCREGAHRAGQAEAHGTRSTVGESGELLRPLKVTKALAAVADSHHRCLSDVKLSRVHRGLGDFGNESWWEARWITCIHTYNNMETRWHKTHFLPFINDIDTLKLI